MGAFILVLIIKGLFPKAIPFGLFEFWAITGPLLDGIIAGWPIFAWGAGISIIGAVLTRNNPEVNRNAERLLWGGFFISAFAGITEEIAFRWLIFLNAIWGIKLTNFLFFDFAGFGIPRIIYTYVVAPVTNFVTVGQARGIIYHPLGWFVGSAVIAANAKFRDGHKYQGIFGWINSWFGGLFLFWLMFKHGLVACIIVHFLYDMLIFIVAYIDAAIERARGFTK